MHGALLSKIFTVSCICRTSLYFLSNAGHRIIEILTLKVRNYDKRRASVEFTSRRNWFEICQRLEQPRENMGVRYAKCAFYPGIISRTKTLAWMHFASERYWYTLRAARSIFHRHHSREPVHVRTYQYESIWIKIDSDGLISNLHTALSSSLHDLYYLHIGPISGEEWQKNR